MKLSKKIISALCVLSLLPYLALPASANSAQQNWKGRDESGVVIMDGDCPLVVEHETLTFDLHEFPAYRNYNESELESYTGRVSAEYTFYNPSDLTVTARMAFPLTDTYQSYAGQFEDYQITVNGEVVEAQMRHTVSKYNEKFDVDTDLPHLKDEYITDDFFTSGDMTVTKYVMTMPYFEGGEYWGGARCGIDIDPADYPNTMFYFPDRVSCNILEDGTYRAYSGRVRYYSTITYYAIGEVPSTLPTFNVYYDWHCNDDEVLARGSKVEMVETLTLNDLIFMDYDESSDVSRMDWYNANLEILMERRMAKSPFAYISDFTRRTSYNTYNLLVWYCYEVTVGPGERIVNKVSAPMYPDVNTSNKIAKYTYTYLLSPAGTWADFGDLDIYVNTPYYLSKSSLGDFEKTENGYELHLDGLPKDESGEYKELTFMLKTEPTRMEKSADGVKSIFNAIGAFFKRIIEFFRNIFTK